MQNIKTGNLIDPETSEPLNDVETTLNGMGIKLRENENTWRNFGDVLDEVAGKWQNFSDTQKSALATAFAGTRQKEIFITLMENYDSATKYAESATNAMGTANEKYAIYMESVEAKQNQLTASFQEFYNNFLKSDFIKNLLDIANGFMKIANAGEGAVGRISLLLLGISALNLLIKSARLESFRAILTEIGGAVGSLVTSFPALINGLKSWLSGSVSLTTALRTQKVAQDQANASAMANPYVAIAEIAVFAIIGITTAIKKHNEAIQESIEKADELRETYKSTSEEFADNLKTLTETTSTTASGKQYENLNAEFADLCKGVDAYGNNLSLTNEQYERYKSICEQIIGLNPDLMDGYDSEIEAIGNRNGLLQDTIDLLQQEARERAKAYADSSDETLEGSQNKYDKDIKEIAESAGKKNSDLFYQIFNAGKSRGDMGGIGDLFDSQEKAIADHIDAILKDVDGYWDDIYATMSGNDYYTDEMIASYKEQYYAFIDEISASKDELANSMDETWKAVLQSSEEYSDLDSGTRSWLNQYIIDNFKIDDNTKEETVNEYKKTILDILNSISGDTSEAENARKALSELFTLDSDDISYEEYKQKVNEVVELISKLTGQDKNKIKISLGFDVDTDELEGLGEENEIIDKLSSKFGETTGEVKDKLNDMSKSSIDALLKMDESVLQNCDSWDDLKAKIYDASEEIQSMEDVFSGYANNLQGLSEQYEILSKAQDEYNQYGNLTASTMKKIIDNGLLDYLTVQNGQLQFNTQALQNNANSLQENAIANLQSALFTDLNSIAQGTYQEAINSTDTSNANAQLQNFQAELSNTTNQALTTANAISALNSSLGTNYQFSDKQKAQADKVVANYNAMVTKVKALSTNLSTGTYRSSSSSGSSGSGSKSSSKSEKQWWETQLEKLKDQLEYNSITMNTYISGLEKLLKKVKKGSEAWKEINKELQDTKLDNLKNQFDRGEITIDQYIKGLEKLRKAYKKNTEGYKELTKTINETKADKFADQYERGEISLNSYIKKLTSLRNQYKKNSEEWKKYNDLIGETKLDKYLDNLEKGLDNINNAIDKLGKVNTAKEQTQYATLLSKKYKLIKSDISDIQKQLKSSNLTSEQRVKLQEKLNDLLKEEVDVRDEIEDSIRTYYENQKEQLEQQAELTKKQTLYNKEVELYGKQGKEIFEYNTQKEIEALEAKQEALDKINEREELENDLLEAKLKLQNALNNKTTKILTKQDDGTWQYTFSANMTEVQNARDDIQSAQKALDDYKLQEQIDKLNENMENLANQYEDAEFWAEREYEQTMNSIELAYGNIDKLVADWMNKYGTNTDKLTKSYESVVKANNSLESSLKSLETSINAHYETVGNNGTIGTKDGVKSFDTGGEIKGSGLALVHDKERVLTQKQNVDFIKLLNNIDTLNKLIDISKVSIPNYKNINSNIKSKDSNSQVVINGVNCNFPNVTSPDGIQKAILELPRLALQYKK